ncbi:MAG: restriction endonuclease subunit S [Bacteroidales bacterium]|nr:restriction endonuclease subunit S [Bacteroidales bacterium]
MMDNKHSNIPQGYKYSSLGIIPKEWEVRNLGDIFFLLGSFSFSRDQMTIEQQKLNYIHYGDIHLNKEKDCVDLKKDKLPFIFDGLIKKERLVDSTFPYLKNGDIILADASEDYEGIGKSWEIIETNNHKVISGLHTMPLRCNTNEIALGFGRYLFKNTKSAIALKQVAQGTKVYSISYNHISKLEVLVPPLPEQQKIAEILSVWDRSIEMHSRLIESLQTRKCALMQRLLTGKKRISGFNTPWQTVKLKDLFTERVETNVVDLPLLSITADLGIIYQTDSDKKDNSNDDKSKYKRICEGDIGYNTMRMWQGRSALSYIEGIVSPAYTIVTPQKGTNVLFFAYLFQTSKVINEFWRHSQGLVSDTLNCKFKDFGTVKVFVPVFAEQTAIAERLTTADREINLAKQKLSYLRTQKYGLMQQLLTGKKRVL